MLNDRSYIHRFYLTALSLPTEGRNRWHGRDNGLRGLLIAFVCNALVFALNLVITSNVSTRLNRLVQFSKRNNRTYHFLHPLYNLRGHIAPHALTILHFISRRLHHYFSVHQDIVTKPLHLRMAVKAVEEFLRFSANVFIDASGHLFPAGEGIVSAGLKGGR